MAAPCDAAGAQAAAKAVEDAAAVDRVLARLAMTEEGALEGVLDRLLPALLAMVTSDPAEALQARTHGGMHSSIRAPGD